MDIELNLRAKQCNTLWCQNAKFLVVTHRTLRNLSINIKKNNMCNLIKKLN